MSYGFAPYRFDEDGGREPDLPENAGFATLLSTDDWALVRVSVEEFSSLDSWEKWVYVSRPLDRCLSSTRNYPPALALGLRAIEQVKVPDDIFDDNKRALFESELLKVILTQLRYQKNSPSVLAEAVRANDDWIEHQHGIFYWVLARSPNGDVFYTYDSISVDLEARSGFLIPEQDFKELPVVENIHYCVEFNRSPRKRKNGA